MKQFWLGFAIAGLAASSPWNAAAQQGTPPPGDLVGRSLEELLNIPVASVEGAARHEQPATAAPASVTVVTAVDIETFGWRTLADVLKSVRGFHITYDRNYTYVGVRGFGRPTDYNNRVLVMVDGQRMNDSIYDGALLGSEFPVDLKVIDRIEIIRGPGSALYGTSAFLAVVNILTRRGVQDGTREVSVEGGSFGTWTARASHGWADKAGRDLLVSVSRYSSAGQPSLLFPEFVGEGGGDGRAVGLDADAATRLFSSYRTPTLRLEAGYAARDKDVPTAAWGTVFGSHDFNTRDARTWANATYTKTGELATVTVRGYYDRYLYTGTYPFEHLMKDGAHANSVGGELSGRRRIGRHQFTLGVEQRSNLQQDQWMDEGPNGLSTSDRTSVEVAAYAQDEVTLTPKLTAIAGARFDWWSRRGRTGRPRLGLVYRTEHDTAIKALYGEAYRAPNVYELYFNDVNGAPTPRPEVARTAELVVERHLGRRLRVGVSGYSTRIEGLIDGTPAADASVIYVNSQTVRSTGVEAEGESRWPSGLLIRGAVSFQRPRGPQGSTLSNAPARLGTMQVAMPFWRRQVSLASDTVFTGARTTVGGTALSGYWLTSANVNYRPSKWPIAAGVAVYNVFGAVFSHPVGVEFRQQAIQQDGRTAFMRLSVRF